MKSQRRNSHTQKKTQRKSQSKNQNNRNNNNNAKNQKQNRKIMKKAIINKNKNKSKNSENNNRHRKSKRSKRSQKQKISRNNKQHKRYRSRKQRRSRNAQRGGYGSLDYSILPCTRDGETSVANFGSNADASSHICSHDLDMLRDGEHNVASGVSTIGGLSDFVQGGTTQVINEKTGEGGDGLTNEQQRQFMDNVANESTYRNLVKMDGEEGRQTRSASDQSTYQVLGLEEGDRWSRLGTRGATGSGKLFEERVEYVAPQ
jgi:hypothetical protein